VSVSPTPTTYVAYVTKLLCTGLHDELPTETNHCDKIKAIFKWITCNTRPFTDKIDTALTYHIQGTTSSCGWRTKKSNYTCMTQTTPPHFLTGKSCNACGKQAISTWNECCKGGPDRIPEQRATGVYGFYGRGQRSRQCNTNTNEMLCGKATRNRRKDQMKSRD
jgi:hypothetical protein